MHKKLNIVLYVLFGVGSLAVGIMGLLAPFDLFKGVTSGLYGEEQHLAQELGCAAIFVGLVAFWCVFNYDSAFTMHLLLIVLFALLAWVHWFEFFRYTRSAVNPLLNTLPVTLLIVMVILRKRRKVGTEGGDTETQ